MKVDTFKVLRYKNIPTTNTDEFFITPIELERYKVERLRRMQNLNTGGVKFEAQTEAGGKDYTELVFRLKVGGKDIGIPIERTTPSKSFWSKRFSTFKNPSHFNVKNEIAHVRFKTRELDGLKVLNVEEMQSDFAIASKRKLVHLLRIFHLKIIGMN